MKDKFLWGAATSAFQVEGAYNEDGRGLAMTDVRSFKKSHKQADTKVAMDHYHRYEEDIQLMKELGINSYRFSISWTRIFPNGDDVKPNRKGVQFYDRIVDLLLENNIEPVITLHHYDFPVALLEKYGGWLSRQMIDDFERYAIFMFEHFKGRVKYWLTLNEQGVVAISNSMLGVEEEDIEKAAKMRHQMNHHMFLANAKAIIACHKIIPDAKIAPVLSYMSAYPASSDPKDVLAAKQAEDFMSFYMTDVYVYGTYPKYYTNFLESRGWMFETKPEDEQILKAAKPDFLAVNWYCSWMAKAVDSDYVKKMLEKHPELKAMAREYYGKFDGYTFVENPFLERNKWGWQIDPLGFRLTLRKMYEMYRLPIMVTENGLGFEDVLVDGKVHDDYRIDYLSKYISNMQEAMNDGVEMMGYFVWSMIDLLSSSDGISKRYGLVYVNREDFDLKDMKRIKKDSFYWYQDFLKKVNK